MSFRGGGIIPYVIFLYDNLFSIWYKQNLHLRRFQMHHFDYSQTLSTMYYMGFTRTQIESQLASLK